MYILAYYRLVSSWPTTFAKLIKKKNTDRNSTFRQNCTFNEVSQEIMSMLLIVEAKLNQRMRLAELRNQNSEFYLT